MQLNLAAVVLHSFDSAATRSIHMSGFLVFSGPFGTSDVSYQLQSISAHMVLCGY